MLEIMDIFLKLAIISPLYLVGENKYVVKCDSTCRKLICAYRTLIELNPLSLVNELCNYDFLHVIISSARQFICHLPLLFSV